MLWCPLNCCLLGLASQGNSDLEKKRDQEPVCGKLQANTSLNITLDPHLAGVEGQLEGDRGPCGVVEGGRPAVGGRAHHRWLVACCAGLNVCAFVDLACAFLSLNSPVSWSPLSCESPDAKSLPERYVTDTPRATKCQVWLQPQPSCRASPLITRRPKTTVKFTPQKLSRAI